MEPSDRHRFFSLAVNPGKRRRIEYPILSETPEFHIVTVTAHEDDYYEWESTCDGSCHLWEECRVEGCEPTDAERDDCEYTRHGDFHELKEGFWAVDIPGCALTHFDSGTDGVDDLLRRFECQVGDRFYVDVEYLGDGDFWVGRIANPVPAVLGYDPTKERETK